MAKLSVLFVCTANICRSPMAEGLCKARLRQLGLKKVRVASAGLRAGRARLRPDPRACQLMDGLGMDIRGIRSRPLLPKDFLRHDYILTMEREQLTLLQSLSPDNSRAQCKTLMEFSPYNPTENIPDPYFGNREGFQRVLDLLEPAIEGFLNHLERHHCQ